MNIKTIGTGFEKLRAMSRVAVTDGELILGDRRLYLIISYRKLAGNRRHGRSPGSRILDPGYRLLDDARSWILGGRTYQDPGSCILVPDPGSWIQDPGS